MAEKTKKAAADEAAVAQKIASWSDRYRPIGERIHEIIVDTVPGVKPKLWYGAAGYSTGGPVQVFFRVDEYMSFGLTEKANVSVEPGAEDQLIQSAWYITSLDKPTEERIASIVRKAIR